MHPWIDTNEAFRAFCQALPAGVPIALDTEFVWTKTYFPQFALLQIGIDRTHAGIVDPLAITDWAPLAELLTDATRRKILFSGHNDMPILLRACGDGVLPQNVFDVQLAAGFCGESSVQSLKAVIETHLGISLAKTESRSDWTIRPLTAKQLEYAADDVVLLPELAVEFEAKLAANGNLSWFQEETEATYCKAEAYELPPVEGAWRRLNGLSRVKDSMVRRRACGLAIWRDKAGRENDIARPRLLSDEQLYWCAYEAPDTETALYKMPQCWSKRIRHFADEILSCIANPPQEPVVTRGPHLPKDKLNILSDRVLNFLRKRAAEHQIDSGIVGNRHDADMLAAAILQRKAPEGKLFTGWRGELLSGLSEIKVN